VTGGEPVPPAAYTDHVVIDRKRGPVYPAGTLANSIRVPYYQILTMYTSLRIGIPTRNDLAGLSLRLVPPDAITGPARI
jgi:hypothetical protein